MDISVCNYIRILNSYVIVTYENFTYDLFSVINYVLHTDLASYIQIDDVCNIKFSCSVTNSP